MPTMPKLFAAVLFAVLGWFAADLVGAHLPPESLQGALRPLSGFFGLMIGWRFIGPRAGGGWRAACGLGLSGAVFLVLIGLMWFSGYQMIRRAMRMAYGGNPFEALEDMFQIAFDNLEYLAHPDVIGALVLGSMAVGLIVEAVARKWS